MWNRRGQGVIIIGTVILLLTTIPALSGEKMAAGIIVPVHGVIPRTQRYDSYTLFLFCDDRHEIFITREQLAPKLPPPRERRGARLENFASTEYKDKVYALESKFKTLSKRLGKSGLAIWFSQYYARKRGWQLNGANIEVGSDVAIDRSEVFNDPIDIDYTRSKSYCDKLGLPYTDGTYVVTMRAHPDDFDKNQNQALVVQLGSTSVDGTLKILNVLEQGLVTSHPDLATKLSYIEWKIFLQDIWNRHGSKISAGIKFLVEVIGTRK